ncbi:MAG: hypothetical protein ACKO3G_02615 [Planctomycetaceae bacterium]
MTGPRPPRRAGAALALVAASLVLPGAGHGARGDDEPVRLAYRFRAGEEVVMQVAHRAHSDTTINGVTQSTETATESKKRWRVVEVTPDGKATIEHSVDDVTMSSRTSDQGEVRWSSGGEAPPPPGYEGVPGSLGRPLSRVVIDGAGRVLSRTQLFPSPESATGDLMVVPLPDDPVEPGAEWTVPQELVVEVPGGPRRAVRTRLRYRLAGVRDDLATISVDTTVLTPVDDPRLEARLIERIWDGTIEFDVATGRVVSRSTGIDRRVVGFSGEQSSVRYRSSLEERLVAGADDRD